MLAYVFWHRPRPEAERSVYEQALAGYHRALAEEAVEGFHGSSSYEVDSLPWLDGEAAYEDWYLLEAAWALDGLGGIAVSGPLEEPHRRVASLTGSMTAGLYRLVAGESWDGGHAAWFGRPLEDLPGSVWRRQFVLGPTPEYCLVSDTPVALGRAQHLTRRRVI